MARYIDADRLWERAKQLEDEAREELDKSKSGTDRRLIWLSALNERTSFKFDIQDAPTANVIELDAATICGYPVYETSIFVQVLQKYNVSPSEVKEFVTTLENALKVVQDSYKATYDEATKMWTGTYEVPTNMAGLYKMMREQGK